MNKIYAFTGASGTGKTTLLNEINNLKGMIKTIELSGRPYLPKDGDYVSNKSDSINRRIGYGSLVTITQSLLENKHHSLFFSRCAIDRLAYSRTLDVGRDLDDITIKEIKEIVIPYIQVFYLPVEFDIPKDENDIIRGNNEDIRKATDENVKKILKEFNVPHNTLSGSVEDRFKILKAYF